MGVARPRNVLPPPLPPAERTVGQTIAETIRLYGDRFWPSIALGLGPAILFAIVQPLPVVLQLPVAAGAGSVLMTASYIGACLIVGGPAPRRAIWYGFVVGFLIWPTVALLPLLFAATGSVWITLIGPFLPILLWLAYVGMAVPAAVIERLDYRLALQRGIDLAKVDFVHVLGTLVTLVITYHLTGGVLYLLEDEVLTEKLHKNVKRVPLTLADEDELRGLLRQHAGKTGSHRATTLLNNWPEARGQFAKVVPA